MLNQPSWDDLESWISFTLSRGPHEKFDKYWNLYRGTAFINKPEGLYFRINEDATYRNIVVAGDGRIVDIEADESSNTEAISVSPYRAFSGVGLYMGAIATLPRTESSLLTVACRVSGSNSLGPYWSAHNQEEVERLRTFANILVKAVSCQQWVEK